MTKSSEYYFGTGRRKTAIAQVRLVSGTGKFIDIKKPDANFSQEYISEAIEPLALLSLQKKYDVNFIVSGGGRKSHLGAIKLGIARALAKTSEEAEKTLKKVNLLSRDPREKERKKPGLKRARRAPQWAKR